MLASHILIYTHLPVGVGVFSLPTCSQVCTLKPPRLEETARTVGLVLPTGTLEKWLFSLYNLYSSVYVKIPKVRGNCQMSFYQ